MKQQTVYLGTTQACYRVHMGKCSPTIEAAEIRGVGLEVCNISSVKSASGD